MTSHTKTPRRQGRLKAMSVAAELLGCNRSHLWRVITGKRKSPTLLAAYKSLISRDPCKSASFVRSLALTRSIRHDLEKLSIRISLLERLLERAESKTMKSHPSLSEAEARRDYFLKEMEREESESSQPTPTEAA